MKKIIIGILCLCFCCMSNAATAISTTDASYQEGVKPKGKWLGRLKTVGKIVAVKNTGKVIKYGLGGAVVLGGTGYLAYKVYKSSGLDNYIARKIATDDPDSIVISHLSERITNDLNNPKKNHVDIIMEAKEELGYYIVRYPNTIYSKRAISAAIETGLYDSNYQERLNTDSKAYENIKARFNVIAKKVEREYPIKCGPIEKDVIKNVMPISVFSYKNIHSPAEEWDNGAYKDLTYKSDPDTRENDHIPAKAFVLKYLAVRDNNGVNYSGKTFDNIVNNASAVNIEKKLHHDGRTIRDKVLYKTLYDNLSLATIEDFSWHYINSNYDPNVLVAMEQVYLRNHILCLYQ